MLLKKRVGMSKQRIARTVLLVLAIGAVSAVGGARVTGDPPGWMAGCWLSIADNSWTEECWTSPRAGTMLGSGRSGAGKGADAVLKSWEATQILPDARGVPVFWAAPQGGKRVASPMLSRGADEIVFANPAHDYPQRIRYWREGKHLNAEIALADGSRATSWRYEPM